SRQAISLVLASQHYGLPIDPAEIEGVFRDIGDWLTPVPEVSALFYEEEGSLADSFEFLSQFEGAEDRLFPGYAAFEVSIDDRVLTERKSLRGALERKKIRLLEDSVREGRAMIDQAVSMARLIDPGEEVSLPVESALLDADHLTAVKLALKTKRLPVTEYDRIVRKDRNLPLHQRLSTGISGIPVDTYFQESFQSCEFTQETLRLAEFLVTNQRAFKNRSMTGPNDDQKVADFARLCQDPGLLRALFVFTCHDRAEWESESDEPDRWFNIRELYRKTRLSYHPEFDAHQSLNQAGYGPDEIEVHKDFGNGLFTGDYRQFTNRFGSHLFRLANRESEPSLRPKVSLIRRGRSTILGVAARDSRGLAGAVSGACWHHGIRLGQAHLFSSPRFQLALDFFHLAASSPKPENETLTAIEEAISERRFIGPKEASTVPPIDCDLSLIQWRPDRHCLRGQTTGDSGALIYALTYHIYQQLGGNVFSLTSRKGSGQTSYVSVYLSLPEGQSLDEARQLVESRFPHLSGQAASANPDRPTNYS
ncbi:MAG: hypothetical protein AAF514_08035, partial [Verrucomicrobiota bacterium]